MDFRLDDEQLALQEGVSSFCASRYPIEQIAERDPSTDAKAGWPDLAGLGVLSLLVPEADGGLGLGLVEAAIVFEQLGAHLVSGPLLWSTLAARVVDGVADGSVVVGGYDAVGDPDGLALVEHADVVDALVVIRPSGVHLVEGSELPAPTMGEPFDPLTPVGTFAELPAGRLLAGPDEVGRWRAEAAVLAAAVLLGVSDGATRAARDYSLERQQFGVPIGSFQALKHLMADMFVRTNLARSATYAAAAVLDDPVVGDRDRAAATAKLLAGEAAVANGKAAVQVLGGMGFTWEMPPNFFLKRAWVYEQLLGTAEDHALAIADALAADPT